MPLPHSTSRPFVRQRPGGAYWYAKWYRQGKPVMRALGRAWVESDGNGGWRGRRGRAPEGTLTKAQAAARMLELVEAHDQEQTQLEADADERRRRGVTFRELAAEWLVYLEHEKGAKPSTLRDYRWLLAEPGQALALRWGDVNLVDCRLVVHRALSDRVEGPTKSWPARFLPIADRAAEVFAWLAEREDFTLADDYVFCSRLGRPLDGSALRRRFKAAAAAAGLRVLRFHALRHGAGSLVARQADPRWVQGFLGPSVIRRGERPPRGLPGRSTTVAAS